MAGVTIDIPGVGNVEAKNAATEATLKEILKALRGGALGSGGAGSKGGAAATTGGAGGGVMGGLQKSAAGANKALGAAGKGLGMVTSAAGLLGKGLGLATGSLFKLPGAAIAVAQGFSALALKATDIINDLANVGDSLTAAAGALRNIPVVGGLLAGVLGAVAAAAEKSAASFKAATASGATFGGSIGNFSRAASEAGMTMDQFGQFIGKNGAAMLGLGTTTEEGAKRFGQVSKALRSTSNDLYALGFGTKEINEGLANYSALLRAQGLQGTKNNAELAKGAKSYLKEMDLLAKVTGEERSAKEKQMADLARDAQFQAAMAGLDEKARASFQATVAGVPGPLQGFVKDVLATGTATSEENQKIMAMMGPGVAAELTRFHQKLQRGEELTLAERNRLNNIMIEAGKKQLQSSKGALAANREMDAATGAMASAATMNKDALLNASKEQDKAAKSTDGQLKTIEESKAALAEFSNAFTQALASSGLLGVLMSAFTKLATFAMNVLVPAFQIIGGVIEKVWFGFEMLLKPVVTYISNAFKQFGGTVSFIDTILNTTFTILNGLVRGGILAFDGLFKGVTGLLQPLKDLWEAVFGTSSEVSSFADILIDAGSLIGGIFEFLGAVLKDVIGVVIDIVKWFKEIVNSSEFLSRIARGLGDAFDYVRKIMSPAGWELIKAGVKDFLMSNISDVFGNLSDWFGNLIDTILNIIPNALGGISDEEKKKRDEAREERKKAREEAAAARKKDIQAAEKKVEADVQQRKEKTDQHKKEMREDSRKFSEKSALEQKGLDAKKDQQRQEEQINKNYKDPLQLLKDQAKQQKSDLIPKASPQTSKTTEAMAAASQNRKNIETEAERQKQAEEAARKAGLSEQERRQQEAGKPTTAAGQRSPATQETAESLLASLNTKMDRLINLNIKMTDTADRQLTVQQGLTGDLFRA